MILMLHSSCKGAGLDMPPSPIGDPPGKENTAEFHRIRSYQAPVSSLPSHPHYICGEPRGKPVESDIHVCVYIVFCSQIMKSWTRFPPEYPPVA